MLKHFSSILRLLALPNSFLRGFWKIVTSRELLMSRVTKCPATQSSHCPCWSPR